jgi:hypothetical protein
MSNRGGAAEYAVDGAVYGIVAANIERDTFQRQLLGARQ